MWFAVLRREECNDHRGVQTGNPVITGTRAVPISRSKELRR
jgi:hypothetical protein